MAARPGSSSYGALTVGVQSVAQVEVLFKVARTAFRPVPRVESNVVRIRPLSPPPMPENEENDLRNLTRAAFGWRRKQFQRILRDHPRYRLTSDQLQRIEGAFHHSLTRRPETFSPSEFHHLSRLLAREVTSGDADPA
jgi:16S rRNA (adenine1518-N6/adenine1519-N6)-dimethyltransferase